MDKEVELIFRTSLDGQFTMNVPEPREDLTLASATTVMHTIIDKNVFMTKTGELVGIIEARIHTSETIPLV